MKHDISVFICRDIFLSEKILTDLPFKFKRILEISKNRKVPKCVEDLSQKFKFLVLLVTFRISKYDNSISLKQHSEIVEKCETI